MVIQGNVIPGKVIGASSHIQTLFCSDEKEEVIQRDPQMTVDEKFRNVEDFKDGEMKP